MTFPFDCTLQSSDATTHPIWVVGHSALVNQLADSYYDVPSPPSFYQIESVHSVHDALKDTNPDSNQLLLVYTSGLSFADFDEVDAIRRQHLNVSVAVCFAGQHLGYVGYAWALNFAAYLTTHDSLANTRTIINQVHRRADNVTLHSPVFCDWLRQYGILFKHDQQCHDPI